MRRLNKAILAGGVVYPAGTAATPELEAVITNPAHWDGDPDPAAEGTDPETVGYPAYTVAELNALIDGRNTDRDEPARIAPDGSRKADLIAALEADDQAYAKD